MDGDQPGFDWGGLSDFINSVEGPTLGVISLVKGGSVSQGADGTFSATSSSQNGTFAGPGAAGTGYAAPLAADVSQSVIASAPFNVGGFALSPGIILIGLAAALGIFAIAKS